MTTTNPAPPPPKQRTAADNVMNDLIVKPTDTVLGQVGALRNDVAADVKDLGHLVLQPVVDILTTTRSGENDDDKPSNADTIDMFAKTASAIFNAVVIYAIADIRNLIRNHRDQMVGDPDMIQQLITLPITDVNVMMIIMENLALLQQMMKKGEIDFYISAVHRYRKELATTTLKELSQRGTNTNIHDNIQANSENDNNKSTSMTTTDEVVANATTPLPPGDTRRTRTRRRSMFESIQQTQQQQVRVPNTLEVFDDEYSLKELVYAISINREKKQIMITFRGSVTAKDWFVDGKFFLTDVPNPLWLLKQKQQGDGKVHDETIPQRRRQLDYKFSIPQSRCIGIHTGFYEYLFATRSKTDGISKYRQILNSLQTLFDNEEALCSFSINVTGHSLGGALATLFSFFLVLETDWIVPQLPVTCISFASPKGGNIQFARAFQELELQKQIICLRVANYRDLITERPDRLTCWTFCFQDAIFRHVGIELLLYPERTDASNRAKQKSNEDKRYRIRYPRVRRSRLSQFSDDFWLSLVNTIHCTASVTCGCCIHDYMQWHSCDEYLNRVEQIENALESVPMQELYNRYHTAVSEESEVFTIPIRTLSRNISTQAPLPPDR